MIVPATARAATTRPCIVLISPHSSFRLGPYIRAAESLNVKVVVVSESEYSLISAVASGVHVKFNDPHVAEQIVAQLSEDTVRAVIGTDDQTVVIAAHVCQLLGLIHNDPGASQYTRRKDLARMCLSDAPVQIPAFEKHKLQQLIEAPKTALEFPCVLKPLALSGSRGVMRVDNLAQLQLAATRLQTILSSVNDATERDYALLEQYIPGLEYAYEGLLDKGQLQTLTLFDKPDEMRGPLFEETYYITPSRLPSATQQQIQQAVQQACKAYGLINGPVHAEVRIYDDQIWFIEMASRTIGGQCAQLIQYATGMSLEEIVVRQASTMPLELKNVQYAAGVLMIPTTTHGLLQRVEGILEANKMEWIEDIEISIRGGNEIIPLPEGDSYLGFIFARAPTPAQVEAALRKAYAQLKIITTPLLHISQ